MFLNEKTLRGNKLIVYVILKILKKCTDAHVSSFTIKFAVHNALSHERFETQDVNVGLEKALGYSTIRGKFDRVHPALAEIGVTSLELTNNGIRFYMNN